MAMLAVLILPLFDPRLLGGLGGAAGQRWRASPIPARTASPRSSMPISSAAGNNGSAFAGLTANAPWYNTTLGIAMLAGRFGIIVPVLAIAGVARGQAQAGAVGRHVPHPWRRCSSACSSASS